MFKVANEIYDEKLDPSSVLIRDIEGILLENDSLVILNGDYFVVLNKDGDFFDVGLFRETDYATVKDFMDEKNREIKIKKLFKTLTIKISL